MFPPKIYISAGVESMGGHWRHWWHHVVYRLHVLLPPILVSLLSRPHHISKTLESVCKIISAVCSMKLISFHSLIDFVPKPYKVRVKYICLKKGTILDLASIIDSTFCFPKCLWFSKLFRDASISPLCQWIMNETLIMQCQNSLHPSPTSCLASLDPCSIKHFSIIFRTNAVISNQQNNHRCCCWHLVHSDNLDWEWGARWAWASYPTINTLLLRRSHKWLTGNYLQHLVKFTGPTILFYFSQKSEFHNEYKKIFHPETFK